MIVIDTNVVSEPLKPQADTAVLAWLDRQAEQVLYLTATSLAELLVGVEKLPEGRRKTFLAQSLKPRLANWFGPRVLAFDETAAMAYAKLVSRARAAGRTISFADGQIAAIAHTHGFIVATRDTAPFEAAGVQVINPWQA